LGLSDLLKTYAPDIAQVSIIFAIVASYLVSWEMVGEKLRDEAIEMIGHLGVETSEEVAVVCLMVVIFSLL